MVTAAEIVTRMKEREERKPATLWWPNKSDVLEWVAGNVGAVGPLFDQVATLLADGYQRGHLTFEFCSGMVNGMYAEFMELPLTEMPAVFYDVFLAFDAGEYPHKGDDPSVSPVTKYTDPAIRKIIDGLTA